MAADFGTQSKIYGNLGLVLAEAGDITKDRFGLETGSCVFNCLPEVVFTARPAKNSAHPKAAWLKLVRSRISYQQKNKAAIICDYEGCNEVSDPEYECVIGTTEEPIVTHPRFRDYIGGTAASPLNGAVFLDTDGEPSADNNDAVFDHFNAWVITGAYSGGFYAEPNPFAGIENYVDGGKVCWRQSYVTPFYPDEGQFVGTIQKPPGFPPNYPGRNWLFMGLNMKIRGGAYFIQKEWMLSGPRGWNTSIYGTS